MAVTNILIEEKIVLTLDDKKMIAQLRKDEQAFTQSVGKMQATSNKLTGAIQKTQVQSLSAGSAFGVLSAQAGVMGGAFGSAASPVIGLGAAMAGMGAALGPVTIALAAATFGIALFARAWSEASEKAEIARETFKGAVDDLIAFQDKTRAATKGVLGDKIITLRGQLRGSRGQIESGGEVTQRGLDRQLIELKDQRDKLRRALRTVAFNQLSDEDQAFQERITENALKTIKKQEDAIAKIRKAEKLLLSRRLADFDKSEADKAKTFQLAAAKKLEDDKRKIALQAQKVRLKELRENVARHQESLKAIDKRSAAIATRGVSSIVDARQFTQLSSVASQLGRTTKSTTDLKRERLELERTSHLSAIEKTLKRIERISESGGGGLAP